MSGNMLVEDCCSPSEEQEQLNGSSSHGGPGSSKRRKPEQDALGTYDEVEDREYAGRVVKKLRAGTCVECESPQDGTGTHTPAQVLASPARLTMSAFQRRALAILKQFVPEGSFTTYKELATACGSHARAVGNAMRRNPFSPLYPCHRVLRTNLSIGGYAGAVDAGTALVQKKIAILRREGIRFDSHGVVELGCRAQMVTFDTAVPEEDIRYEF